MITSTKISKKKLVTNDSSNNRVIKSIDDSLNGLKNIKLTFVFGKTAKMTIPLSGQRARVVAIAKDILDKYRQDFQNLAKR